MLTSTLRMSLADSRLRIFSNHARRINLILQRCKSSDKVTIGNVSVELHKAKHLQKVPVSYLPSDTSQSLLSHLKWMMQKDLLGQDMFLIGSPGPMRRRIALMYLEMTNREHEYLALSRDTTEADLKQRREIRDGTAYYVDQCAVRAAIEGRVLVLEGIEKAERNVLPVLNNLLENREMQLEDGRFLMKGSTYDKLLKTHEQQELDRWNIVRVCDEFRVIALGLPIPRYQGNPLDPPLRSRFQARDIGNIPFKEQYEVLRHVYPALDTSLLSEILSFSHTISQEEATSLGIADFPLSNIPLMAALMNDFPEMRGDTALVRLYPYNVFLAEEGKKAVTSTLEKFDLGNMTDQASKISHIEDVTTSADSQHEALISMQDGTSFSVKCGNKTLNASEEHYIPTPYHNRLITVLMRSHKYHDMCIIGPKGCGKSTVVNKLASLLGYNTEPILLYQDMTSRDLLQQRTTLANGDTAWRPSPLIDAITKGHVAVLDGLHRINGGTLSVLASLIQDRELNLADGSRLLRHDRFDELASKLDKTTEELHEMGVLRIHPSFRIIALAEPPDLTTASGQWLNAEMLSNFIFHHMTPLPSADEVKVIDSLAGNHASEALFNLSDHLRRSRDPTCQALANSLSTRNLLRIAKRVSNFPNESLYDIIHNACMSRFLPKLAKQTLDQTLDQIGIAPPTLQDVDLELSTSCSVKDNTLRIGNTESAISQTKNMMKVPDTLFYDNPMHIAIMESMLKDYISGEHMLLVGNQGVGKNKVVDRFLQLLGRPREYIQLHRDTTVQTLTLQPTVREGRIVYDDSPLVKAVRDGSVLVIDEADKAPTNVTCVLKTLVESGQMHLSDGRKIVTAESSDTASSYSDRIIHMHPEFRMIVLANRPGFPFLGNDFFAAVGDIFSCHALDNPDIESEISMLRQYGKDVPEHILRKLVLAFGELRSLADQGLISYPYSTREVVSIVKHLQVFSDDGLAVVVSNVFDFDQYNTEMKDTVIETMRKHGIPIGANPSNISLAKEFPLPNISLSSRWSLNVLPDIGASRLSVENKQMRIKGPVQAMIRSYPLQRASARSVKFSELESACQLPLQQENSHISDISSSMGQHRNSDQTSDLIHFVGVNPVSLYTMKPQDSSVSCIDLYDAFPSNRHRYQPSIRIASMGASFYDTVILHEQVANILLLINAESGKVSRVEIGGLLDSMSDAVSRRVNNNRKPSHRMCTDLSHTPDGLLILYEVDSTKLTLLSLLEGTCLEVTLPMPVTYVRMPSPDRWIVEDNNQNSYMIEKRGEDNYRMFSVDDQTTPIPINITATSTQPLDKTSIQAITGTNTETPNRLITTNRSYAAVALGYPELQDVEVYSCERDELIDMRERNRADLVLLPNTAQTIRSISGHQPPALLAKDGEMHDRYASGYLEVTDMINKKLRYLKVSGVGPSPYSMWMRTASGPMIAPLSNDGVVSVDSGGKVQFWETSPALLGSSLQGWTKLIGQAENDLQMTYERDGVKDCSTPKHGKVDPTGNPHVGGNTWAGGTGGRDTAGLGGIGGPYRLDAGHDVHQVSQEVKDQVPEHIRQAAREMGEKAFKERLKQIQMSEYDAEVYDSFYSNVKREIQSTRVVLDSLQARGKERQWLKNQTHGDLDDGRIIEGLTGEKNIYRRRGEKEPELGSPQEKPKRLRLLVDCSGSMYRFNGHDARLQREMEAVCMVMEAFQGYEQKLKFDIFAHSGEDYNVELTNTKSPPANNKQRLQVLQTMHAHSQFCLSGDFTLKATRHAIKQISKEEADEHFVVVLSDANLERYGIPASSFADALTSADNVNAYAIFIGSLGDQADRLVKQLPSGHSFACLDTSKLPQIIQQIFSSTLLR